MDRIIIRDLRLRCTIGAFPHEREHPQEVLLNLDLYTDISAAAASDQLSEAVDYKDLKFRILDLAESSSFRLVETLAESIAGSVLKDKRIQAVKLRLEKPGALTFARTVGVEIERKREDVKL